MGKILQELRKNMIQAHKINLEYLRWENIQFLKEKKLTKKEIIECNLKLRS